MKFYNKISILSFILYGILLVAPAHSKPILGMPAPQFKGTDSKGNKILLSNYQGKLVVLEWTNHECPYVKRQYATGNMQMVQRKAKILGVIWISIISSAPGTQGYVSSKEANNLTVSRKANPTNVLLDTTGVIGKLYRARTTPHMYILDKKGILVYKGAIDNDPTSWGGINSNTINYVLDALSELNLGKKITHSATQPYGCSVKYRS